MEDRLLLEIGEKKNGDRVHIACGNTDAAYVVQKLYAHGIVVNWYNSYGLSKPAKRKMEKLRAKYE